MQLDYIETQDNDSLGFIRFIRHYPERWIMIAWGSVANDTLFTAEFIYHHRKSLGDAFLDPVITYDDRWSWTETMLNNQRAFLIRGLWATKGPTGGGPFFSYGFMVPDTNLYYIIDGAVFAPDRVKMPYLWQLDAMMHTLSTEFTL